MKPKIAYMMTRFPKLSETFILREMNELERLGYDIALYPLIFQKESVIHEEAESWIPRIRHFPFVSPDVLKTNWDCLIRDPFAYASLWALVVRENRASLKILSRAVVLFPKVMLMAREMQKQGIEHIHAHFATYPALAAWLIHQLTGIGFSVTVHANDIFVHQKMLDTKLRDAVFIIAISEYNREFLSDAAGSRVRNKTHVIHCGIRTENYRPRHNINQHNERFEILSIGRLEPKKGYRYLIQSCALLREQGISFRCRIIGDGEERPVLERMITEMNLTAMVELLGPLPQKAVARVLPTAHCYVQPSIITPSGRMEGIPVSLMEAMSCNLPVAASDISGIPELVKHGETGWLVPPADASALAETLSAIYANPDQASHIARNGRTFVRHAFELRTNVERLAALFESSIFNEKKSL
ncbi:glycosyltransferase [Desulfonema magnum]|uniref:Glycosyltransferase, family I n=1 Tax=Desulfonema magnum TaxID=45655 RepID=A0A975BV64_9BACT|nr:glycosyltransferase [Desulfonema magnum]QTA91878.1 Glycosyltransferase, family I [Desulfonema magnum]